MKAAGAQVNYVWWARDTAPARRLSRAQRAVLKELASRADKRGCCDPSIGTLADGVAFSQSHTKRVLRELEDLRLVQSRRRGRARTSLRQLCPDAPMPSPTCPCGTMPLFDELLEPAPPAVTPEPQLAVVVSSEGSVGSSDEPQKYQSEEERQQQGTPARPAVKKSVLSPSLPRVLEILSLAPALIVEDYAVDVALRAFPAADHERAAYRVAALALEDGLEHLSASRQLWRALERQLTASTPAAPHAGRRRVAPPRGVSPAGRRWGPVEGGKYNRAAGLV